jgi:voltage-gated potassium channel
VTQVSRLFVISIIVLGITVFATSLGAVIGPVVGGQLRQIIQRKARLAMRKNHIILCGATPLAMNLYQSLTARGEAVTIILKPSVVHPYPDTADLIVGDPSSAEILIEAGVMTAAYVLALRDDDADNAFIVLAVKSFPDCPAKTVALVNANQNLEKIRRVKPDLAFSPQLLGAELLSRAMLGETFDNKMVTDLLFGRVHPNVAP